MDIYRALPPSPLREAVVAIGNFDGVHVGHQALFGRAVESAKSRDGTSVVLTFDPHPAKVLAPSLAPPLITSLPRKLDLIAACGLDACVVLPFTRELAGHSAENFVREVLQAGLGARRIVVGHDFTYGHKREGTVKTLRDSGAFSVDEIPAVTVNGLVASSTKIRELIHEGNVTGAALLLGRAFEVDGEITRGAGRGRGMGVPTANVVTAAELLPRPGVYAGSLDGRPAAINLGTNPTFVTAGKLSLEAHVLDFDGDLYGKTVRVAFHSWIRGEERFNGPDALTAQIRRDILEVRGRLDKPS